MSWYWKRSYAKPWIRFQVVPVVAVNWIPPAIAVFAITTIKSTMKYYSGSMLLSICVSYSVRQKRKFGTVVESTMHFTSHDIAQQLKVNGFSLNYYDEKKTGENDYAIQNGMGIELLEAKSLHDISCILL